MTEELFRVVFGGEVEEGKDPEAVKRAMKEKFKLAPAVIERMMAGRPIVVKNNVPSDVARRYQFKIEMIGGVCYVEPMPLECDTDEKGYIERRKTERRSGNERRSVRRENSIQPDRRKGDRRKG